MTDTMKKLLNIAFLYGKHYEINHNKARETFSIKIWLSSNSFLVFTATKDTDDDHVITKYYESSRSWGLPTPKVGKLDKICGRSKRESYHKFSFIDIGMVQYIVMNIEQYASSDQTHILLPYPFTPEEFV